MTQTSSAVAKLFDPAGYLAPSISAKIFIQRLQLEGLEWDEESESLQIWNNLVQDLFYIDEISIPRWIKYMPENIIQIYGFAES